MESIEAHKSNCYTCESCKKHFKRVREDSECWNEYNENLKRGKEELEPSIEDLEADEVVIICDDCYLELKKKAPWLV